MEQGGAGPRNSARLTGEKPRGGKAGDEPGSNGLFVDTQGRLHLCEHGDRRVTRIEKDGKKTVLADKFEGKRLNSPNDLAIHPNGDVYFTDPPYGLEKGTKRELDFTGVYRISAKDGKLSLVSKDLRPNGIALSPDLKKLYVTNGGSWMVLKVIPILIPLRGILKKQIYTMQWSSMLILLYFTEDVVRVYSDKAWLSSVLAGLEVVLTVLFFFSVIFYLKPYKKAAKAAQIISQDQLKAE